jgi:hypothetical protein
VHAICTNRAAFTQPKNVLDIKTEDIQSGGGYLGTLAWFCGPFRDNTDFQAPGAMEQSERDMYHTTRLLNRTHTASVRASTPP